MLWFRVQNIPLGGQVGGLCSHTELRPRRNTLRESRNKSNSCYRPDAPEGKSCELEIIMGKSIDLFYVQYVRYCRCTS